MKITKDDKQYEEACCDNEKLSRLLSGLIRQRRNHYIVFWMMVALLFMELFGRLFLGDWKMYSSGQSAFLAIMFMGFALHADSKIKVLLCIKAGRKIGRTGSSS